VLCEARVRLPLHERHIGGGMLHADDACGQR